MKPKINISFENGVLGQTTPLATGVFGFVASAEAVADTFALNTAYQLKSMRDVAALGLNGSVPNYRLFKALKEFFQEAGEGTELWLYGVSKSTQVSAWFEKNAGNPGPVESLLNASHGKIRGIFTIYTPSVESVLTEEKMDPDVVAALATAQTLFEDYTSEKYAPYFTILEGYKFTGETVGLPDLSAMDYNAVGVIIGNTEKQTESNQFGAAIGVLAGRLAKYPVRVNAGKVRNGALKPAKMYIKDTLVEDFDTEALYDLGYITLTTYAGRTGYYFMDDPLACNVSDDYHYLTHRRTINEAYRLAYQANLDFVLDEVPVNNDGTIQAWYAKTIESAVERLISTSMGADLSVNPEDTRDSGVQCFVDKEQNIISTSKLNQVVKIRPYGYNRWIEVVIGFDITNS